MSVDAHEADTPSSTGGQRKVVRFVFLGLAALVLILGLKHWWNEPKPPPTAPINQTLSPTAARQPTVAPLPDPISQTTPAEIQIDYHFKLEANKPITIEYDGHTCAYVPDTPLNCPKSNKADPGPKKFWATDDKENGHVSFRIYPVR